jgi:hypothetical protein
MSDTEDTAPTPPPTAEELQAEIDEVKESIAKGEKSAKEAKDGERPKNWT